MAPRLLIELSDEDIRQLEGLIKTLSNTRPQSQDEAKEKRKDRSKRIINRMVETGESWGESSGAPEHLNLPEDSFRAYMRDMNNNIQFQIKITLDTFNQWIECGEPPPPYYPNRVAMILRKAKRFDLEREFLTAYNCHLHGHFTMMKRANFHEIPYPGDTQYVFISIENYYRIDNTTQYHFNFNFKCEKCEGTLIKTPDSGHGMTMCAACGAMFGTMMSIREHCTEIAHEFMKDNGIS